IATQRGTRCGRGAVSDIPRPRHRPAALDGPSLKGVRICATSSTSGSRICSATTWKSVRAYLLKYALEQIGFRTHRAQTTEAQKARTDLSGTELDDERLARVKGLSISASGRHGRGPNPGLFRSDRIYLSYVER